jgi:hypothetical protein
MYLPMIRIPEAIEIGGISYIVKYEEDLPGQTAQIHFLEGVIRIKQGMGDEVTFLSFMHEVTHGVMQAMNHFPDQMIYNDEDFTERTAQLFTSIFKQIHDYNILYDEYFAKQEGEEEIFPEPDKDILDINVPEVE